VRENLLDVGDVQLGLVKVLLEGVAEGRLGCFLSQLGKHLHQRALRVEDVTQLVYEQFSGIVHRFLSSVTRSPHECPMPLSAKRA
jgi:hypothetical protein